MIVTAVIVAARLLAGYRFVDGIEVEDQSFGGTRRRRTELFDQYLVQPPGSSPIGAVFPRTKGWGPGR